MRSEARVLRYQGAVSTRGEASAHLSSPGDAVVIERGRPRWLLISCPCGCGEEFPINLDPRAGPAWKLYRSSRDGVSLFPSVWRESGCGSHFIVWHNKILLVGRDEEGMDSWLQSDGTTLLSDAVLERLPSGGLVSISEIAEAIDAVPWDVLTMCRRLVEKGFARQGKGSQRGFFGRP